MLIIRYGEERTERKSEAEMPPGYFSVSPFWP